MTKDKKTGSPQPEGGAGTPPSRAEKRLTRKGMEPSAWDEAADPRSLNHELGTHRQELELQNEELQKAHQEAEAARRKYFDLYELAPIGYATLTQQGKILEINLTGAELLGQERKFLVHRRFQLFVAQEDVPVFNQFVRSAALSGRRQSCELSLVNNEKHLFEVRLEGISGETELGKEPLCQVSILDISDQKRIERELRKGRSRFQSLIEASPGVIFETDAQGNNTFVSQRWSEWTGMTPAETAGRGWLKAIAIEDRPKELARWRRIIRTGQFKTSTFFRLLNRDGTHRWVKMRAAPTRDASGNIVRWTGTLNDINDLMKAQEQFKRQKAVAERARTEALNEKNQMEAAMEALPVGLAITDRLGGRLRFNQAFTDIWGGSPPEIRSIKDYTPFQAWWTDSGQPLASEEWASARVIQDGQPVLGQLLDIERFDGSRAQIINSAAPILNKAGEVIGSAVAIQDISPLRKSQEALRDREAELSLVLNAVPALIAYVDSDGRYRRVNQQYAQWFGRTAEAVKGLSMADLLGEAQWQEIKPHVEKALAGQTVAYERQLVLPDGKTNWVRASYTPDVEESGQVRGFVVHVIDIEEIKSAEETIRASEENYRRILETANEGIVVGTLDGKMTFVNQKWADMLGYSKEEILGRTGTDFMDEEQKAVVLDTREKLQSGRQVIREFKFQRKDGSELWTLCSSSRFLNREGSLSGFLAMHTDITDRKLAENELRESRDDLNRAQAVARIGSWRMDIQKNELLWSEENHRIFGVPPGTSMTYEAFLAIVHPNDRSYVNREWMAALRGRPYDIEHRIIVGDRVKWVRERAQLEFDAEGILMGGFGTTQDITEKKEAEEALRRSETRFRLLSETAGRLLAEKNPQQAIEELCQNVMNYLDCQVFFNFMADETAGRLRLNAYAGIPKEEAREVEWLDYGVAVCGCAALDRQRIVAEHIFQRPDPRTDLVKGYGVQAYACHPLLAGERVLGTLSFGTMKRPAFSEAELELMKTVADQVALGLERQDLLFSLERAKADLELRVRERTADLKEAGTALRKLSARLISSEETQRKNVAREIHDSLGSCLSGIKYKIEDVIQQIEDPASEVSGTLAKLVPWVQEAITECRRIQADLSPVILYDLGLLSTISWFVRRFESVYKHIRVAKTLDIQEQDIPESLKIVIYRVIQEAFNNIAKHSGADRINLRLDKTENGVLLEVCDFGRGFTMKTESRNGDPETGLGIPGMRERVEWSGGTFFIRTGPQKGTKIRARWVFNVAGQPVATWDNS